MKKILLSLMLFFPVLAYSSVSITGTRVIYNESDNNVTVKLSNRGDSSSVIQAWIDNEMNNQSPSEVKSPFILYPSVFKMDANGEQYLRIKKIDNISNDKESVFWLNVKDIPEAPKDAGDNYLQFAILNKIKLFYRPASLKSINVSDMYQDISWSFHTGKNGNVIAKANNNSPYHASLTEIVINVAGKEKKIGVNMVAPGGSEEWPLSGVTLSDVNHSKIEYGMINDFGSAIYRPIIRK